MAVIGDISVSISARTQKFEQGLKSAGGALASFSGGLVSMAAGAAAAGAAIAAAATGALALLTKKSFENVDAQADFADRIGITIDSLRGLQFAGEQAGAGAAEIEGALEQMSKRIGEAAQGSGEAGKALTTLGLNLADITAMRPDETFKAIADKVKSLENPFQRAQIVTDLFGKSGQELINVLDLGSEGLNESTRRIIELQGSMDRVSAAKIQMANESFNEMGKVISGIGDRIATGVAPVLKAAIDSMINFGFNGENVGRIVVNAMEWIAKAIAKTADFLNLFKAGWHAVAAVFDAVASSIIYGIHQIYENILQLFEFFGVDANASDLAFLEGLRAGFVELDQDVVRHMGNMDQALADFATGTNAQAVTKWFADLRTNSQLAGEKIAAAAEARANKNRSLVEMGPPAELFEKEQKRMEDFAANVFKDTRLPIEKFEEQMKKLAEVFSAGLIKEEEFTRAAKMAQESLFNSLPNATIGGGAFRQIDTSQISVSGLAIGSKSEQKVHDPQVGEGNAILKRIEKKLGIGQVAVTK